MTGNVADFVRDAARGFPAATAFLGDGPDRSWAEVDAAADVGAAELVALGLQPGDRVICQLPTGVALAVALVAVLRADLVAVPTDPGRTDLAATARRVSAAAVIGPDAAPEGIRLIRASAVTGWFGRPAEPVQPRRGGEDLAVLARAGRSDQAVMLSHRAVRAAVQSIVSAPELTPRADDRALLLLPLFHLAGIVTVFLPAAAVGAGLVVTDAVPTHPDQLDDGTWNVFADAVLDAIRQYRVTLLPGAPPLYRLLLRSAELESALGSVRLLTSAAAPLEQSDAAAIRARTGRPVWEGYGVAESSSVVSSTLMSQASVDGSVGPPLPGVEVRIEPDDGTGAGSSIEEFPDEDILVSVDVDADPGRIAVRGAQLFSGYWPDGVGGPEPGGWFVTSDIGYLDAAGELHLIDRLPETIIIAGFTVYPREVEAALLAQPDVRDAAVVGIPGERGTELVALVVLGSDVTGVADPPTPESDVATDSGTDGEPDTAVHAVADAGSDGAVGAGTESDPNADTDATSDPEAALNSRFDALLESRLPSFKRPTRYRAVRMLPRTEVGRLDRTAVVADWKDYLGVDVSDRRSATRLSVVPGSPPLVAAQPPVEPVVLAEPPEVIEVSQLDSLGSRLPGVTSRSRRSAQDTDSDLFGEDWLEPAEGDAAEPR